MYASAFLVKARCVWCLLFASGLGQIHQLADIGANRRAQGPECTTDAPAVSRGAADARSAEKSDACQACRVCRVTAYCDRGLTASGVPSGVGQCAAPADIPFGSRVYIPALDRTLVVTDRTAKRFRHNTVDIFIPTRAGCREFGRHYLQCEFTIPAEPPRYASPRLARAVARLRS